MATLCNINRFFRPKSLDIRGLNDQQNRIELPTNNSVGFSLSIRQAQSLSNNIDEIYTS